MNNLKEADKGWRIKTETTIKAKSIKGFNTNASKVVENKFILDEPSKELLDDWDSRKVESVLELHDSSGGEKLCCKSMFVNKIKCENFSRMSISGAENQSCPSAGMQRGLVLTQTANKDQVK